MGSYRDEAEGDTGLPGSWRGCRFEIRLSGPDHPGYGQALLRDGVLIVSPRLAIAVEHLLRRQILQAHTLRLGEEGRREQRDALYETEMLSWISITEVSLPSLAARLRSAHRSRARDKSRSGC
jgi:hypothetical protein